jgi:hypothetical protein
MSEDFVYLGKSHGLTVLPDNGRIFPAGRIGSRKSLDTLCFTGNKWFVQEPMESRKFSNNQARSVFVS